MIERRGKVYRGGRVLWSAVPAIFHLGRGLSSSGTRKAWVLPLAVFLCLTGLLLVIAGTVEVIAPFIYTIF